jgi:osmotically-inducible protein OsmY
MRTDDELQKDVMAELKWDPQLRDVYTHIGVSVKDGVVTLSGQVDTYSKKIAAERAAQNVHGVKVVATDVEVKVKNLKARTDTEIAEAVRNALQWNSAVNEDKIKVKVDNGWVYLDGLVDWEFQKISAQQNVENLLAVRGVTNNLLIKSKVIDVKEIKDKILSAFQRNAIINETSIKIETAGNKVILRGKVRSWGEKEEAERIAWSCPEVVSVDNQITVNKEMLA